MFPAPLLEPVNWEAAHTQRSLPACPNSLPPPNDPGGNNVGGCTDGPGVQTLKVRAAVGAGRRPR